MILRRYGQPVIPASGIRETGPIFARRFVQLDYNQKAHGLAIRQKCSLHKLCTEQALQKSKELATFSMPVDRRNIYQLLGCGFALVQWTGFVWFILSDASFGVVLAVAILVLERRVSAE